MSGRSELVELQHTLYNSRNPTRRWLHCSRRDWIFSALARHAPPGSTRALEVGPGSGVYLPKLAELFGEVVAADVEQSYLDDLRPLASRDLNLELRQDDITHSGFASDSFDLILCTEVIEHIPDSSSALKEMYRLLKPEGVLVLSTPQRYSPLELCAKIAFLPGIINLVRLVYREPILETGHINLLSQRDLVAQLCAAGFRSRETHKSGVYLPVVAECAGHLGLRLEQWLETALRGGPMDWLLWTQYCVATKHP